MCQACYIYKANVNTEKYEDLEQHGRSNSIRVYGAPDTGSDENEITTEATEDTEDTINPAVQDIEHREGTMAGTNSNA